MNREHFMLHHSKFPCFAFLALLCAAVSGCTTTSVFGTGPEVTSEIGSASADRFALITLYDGTEFRGRNVEIRADSTHWIADTVFAMRSATTGRDLPGQIFET
jgi:hypothetical protein